MCLSLDALKEEAKETEGGWDRRRQGAKEPALREPCSDGGSHGDAGWVGEKETKGGREGRRQEGGRKAEGTGV